jgi:hypothetical protein
MTTSTSTPDSLKAQIAAAPANTTVFSDGSTFDYENGYQSNGAVPATRDRTENPTIAKSHKIVTAGRVLGVLFGLLVLSIFVSVVALVTSLVQESENWKALKAGVNDSEQVEAVQRTYPSNLIVKSPDGGTFKCDVSMISNSGNPVGLVFCAPGGPATFSIPLPHDPANVLYVAPAKDSEHK